MRCRLAEMMGRHKMRIADVARETGMNRATVAALYWERAERINLDVIERLCVLFACQPNELFELVDESSNVPNPAAPRKPRANATKRAAA